MTPTNEHARADRRVVLPVLGVLHNARLSPPTRQGLLRGLLVYRWLTWVWMAVIYSWEVYQRNVRGIGDEVVAQPASGFILVFITLAFTGTLTVLYQKHPDLLMKRAPILTELGLCAVLMLADVWVYGFADHSQSLPSVYVIASVFTVAIAAGQRAAVYAGLGLGLARYVGWLPFATDGEGFYSLVRVANWVLLIVTGWMGGYFLKKLGDADRDISAYRAREEVARTLHDGVLQTLAVIQRRSGDTELIELARTQELELREYLFGGAPVDADLASGLRAAARRAEQRYGLRVNVITAPDLPSGSASAIHAVSGAVGEALTNASKHGEAEKVTVYAEPSDSDFAPHADTESDSDSDSNLGRSDDGKDHYTVFVSVKDDGKGFDEGAVSEGEGLSRSIRGRIADAGGRVEVDGRPGRGAEIKIWV